MESGVRPQQNAPPLSSRAGRGRWAAPRRRATLAVPPRLRAAN